MEMGQARGKSSRKGANARAAEEAATFLRDYFSNQTNAGLGLKKRIRTEQRGRKGEAEQEPCAWVVRGGRGNNN